MYISGLLTELLHYIMHSLCLCTSILETEVVAVKTSCVCQCNSIYAVCYSLIPMVSCLIVIRITKSKVIVIELVVPLYHYHEPHQCLWKDGWEGFYCAECADHMVHGILWLFISHYESQQLLCVIMCWMLYSSVLLTSDWLAISCSFIGTSASDHVIHPPMFQNICVWYATLC